MFTEVIIDSNLRKEVALRQNPHVICPEDIIQCQELIDVTYFSFDGKIHRGQLVIYGELVEDIRTIFNVMLEQRFPITSVIPLADPRFHWDDELSMEADNTSGFNYRMIALSTRLSNHAFGRAIDINPQRNPYITEDFIKPKSAIHNIKEPGTIIRGDTIYSTFKEMGWIWGGDWENHEDYQHFEKPIK